MVHLTSLGFIGPFPILLSHGPLLTLLGFPGPITLYFILGANGSSISPLLSLLILLWACGGPFSLFYILPVGLLPLSFSLPTARPCPLTHDPPLPLLAGYRLVVLESRACFTFFTRCSCICRVLEIGLYILPCTFGFLWCGLFSNLPFFMTCFFWGLGLVGSWAFLPLAYSVFTSWPC